MESGDGVNQKAEKLSTGDALKVTIIKLIIAYVILALVLFLSSGRLDWASGWALLFVGLLVSAISIAITYRTNPELLAERQGLQPGMKRWDIVLALIIVWGQLVVMLTAGLDKRFAWSSQIPALWVVTGGIIYLAGFSLIVWAMAENKFFSAVVRIQSERGHTVQTGGPYRVVRHPGYLGMIIYLCGLPLFLESIWSYIPAIIIILLIMLRTALEDKTLKKELEGYTEYTGSVRYRLLPGIW